MTMRSVVRVVFIIAMAISLSAPLAGTAAACDGDTNPGLC